MRNVVECSVEDAWTGITRLLKRPVLFANGTTHSTLKTIDFFLPDSRRDKKTKQILKYKKYITKLCISRVLNIRGESRDIKLDIIVHNPDISSIKGKGYDVMGSLERSFQ